MYVHVYVQMYKYIHTYIRNDKMKAVFSKKTRSIIPSTNRISKPHANTAATTGRSQPSCTYSYMLRQPGMDRSRRHHGGNYRL